MILFTPFLLTWVPSSFCRLQNLDSRLLLTFPSNVGEYADRLPGSVVMKGGLFLVQTCSLVFNFNAYAFFPEHVPEGGDVDVVQPYQALCR